MAELCNLRAAMAAGLPFTAADQTFFQNVVIRPPKRCKNCRSGKEERSGRPGTVRLRHREHCDLFGCGQPTQCLLNPATVFCGIANRRAKAAAPAADAAGKRVSGSSGGFQRLTRSCLGKTKLCGGS